MNRPHLLWIHVVLLLIISACGSVKPYFGPGSAPSTIDVSSADVAYSLFMVGGVSLDNGSAVIESIRKSANSSSGLILLGDVINMESFSKMNDVEASSDPVLQNIRSLDKSFDPFYLVPGQKEWSEDKKTSLASLTALDKYLKDAKDKGRFVVPAKECGQPTVVRVSDHTIVVLVDSQWAIESASRRGENMSGCELSNVLELKLALKDIFQSHPSDHIIVATHHPVYANGPTAGNYPLSSHLLPLPVIGSVLTGIKTLVASNQHFGHPAYEAYRSAMRSAIDGCKNCIVVSGHEKSLQYFNNGDRHYLVAGSGSEFAHARKGEHAEFSYMSRGYVRADELTSGALRLSFYALDESNKTSRVWQTSILPVRNDGYMDKDPSSIVSHGDSIMLPASTQYSKKRFLRGNFYRREWSVPIKMPVFWLDSVYGGLKPLQLGGGNQTRSLRLVNGNEEQYVLRSIDKKVTVVLPPALRGTFAENIVQDGIAASHPYGALVIPKLAAAVGVYSAIPSVVYVPYQPALGIYNQDIGDGVYLFEERPGGNTSDFPNFGNTEKSFNTADMIEMLAGDHKHHIDQSAVARARLFDVLLGDWDRHDDQWRWAVFEENDRLNYRPIPRDRDQVFYKNDGVLDYLASRPYFNPPLRRFTDKIDHLDGLIWAGKYFDRTFLNQLTEDDFVKEAEEIQKGMTDDVIEEAFKDWPQEIDQLDGARIRKELRARRNDLVIYAREFYKHISGEVFIPGSDDKDLFEIHALGDGVVDVRVTRTNKDGAHLSFHRAFADDVTRELRIYGLEKQDSFRIEGDGRSKMTIRIVGGPGADQVINLSEHLKPKVYDSTNGITIDGKTSSTQLNDKPATNEYDRTDWNINRNFQFVSPTYFTDEGFGLTYTYWLTRHGFRADPFKSRHSAGLSYFLNTGSFIGRYTGEWRNVFGEYDLGFNGFFTGPTFTQYFYGLGNAYVDFGEKTKYHIVSGSQIKLEPSLRRRLGFGSTIALTPSYQYIDVENDNDDPRFVYTPESGLTAEDFGSRHYVGINASYQFERLDNAAYPTRGGDLMIGFGGRTSLGSTSVNHALLTVDASLYVPFDVTGRVVFATHLGGGRIFGEYEFFHALTLGGQDKVRGYRTDRFAGKSRFYHATDLRILLLNKLGVVPFRLGIYGAVDYGRVWYDTVLIDPDEDRWHAAFGGGLFLAPLGLASFRLGYMVGEEDKIVNIGGSLRF